MMAVNGGDRDLPARGAGEIRMVHHSIGDWVPGPRWALGLPPLRHGAVADVIRRSAESYGVTVRTGQRSSSCSPL